MEANGKRKRKKHSEEFKREAVRLLENRGERTVADVAASVGVAENLLHAWKRKLGAPPSRCEGSAGARRPRTS
jgi:transposase-like protein